MAQTLSRKTEDLVYEEPHLWFSGLFSGRHWTRYYTGDMAIPSSRPSNWVSLATCAFCTVVRSYAFSSILPYVGFMAARLRNTSVDGAGFSAGYMISASTLGCALSGYFWGWVSDHGSRKPVLIFSLVTSAACALAFGVSEAYSWALISMFVRGIPISGLIVSIRALLPEVVGQGDLVAAAGYISGSMAVGVVVGSIAGGLLAEPVTHYPSVFSSTGIFSRYPYLLPNIGTASLCVLAIPLVILLITDTHDKNSNGDAGSSPGGYAAALDAEPSENIPVADQISPPHTNGGRTRNPSFKQEDIDGVRVTSLSAKAVEMATSKLSVLGTVTPGYLDNEVALTPTDCQISSNAFNEKSVGRVRRDSVDCVEHHAGDGESERGGEGAIQGESSGMFGVWELFSIPNIPQLLLSGFVFAVVYIGFDMAFTLWAASSLQAGGLKWSTLQIGKALGFAGLASVLYKFFVYAWVVDKMGIANTVRVSNVLLTVMYLVVPNLRYLSWSSSSLFGLVAICAALCRCSAAALHIGLELAFSVQVQPSLRGKLNGLYVTSESIGRMVGPICWSTTFAWSISPSGRSTALVDHHLIFNITAVLMALVTIISWNTLTVKSMMEVVEDLPASTRSPTSAGKNLGNGSLGTPSQTSGEYFGVGNGSLNPHIIENRKADLV